MGWSSDIELPDGSPQEQAEYLLLHIEARSLYVQRQLRLGLRQTIIRKKAESTEYDFYDMLALLADPSVRINIHDIKSSSAMWRDLIPDQPHVYAILAHIIGEKYPFAKQDAAILNEVLHLEEASVETAYQEHFNSPLTSIYSKQSTPDKRPFWLRLPGMNDPAMRADFAVELEWVYLPSGDILFHEGDEGDSIYTIINGRVQVRVNAGTDEEVMLAELGRGAFIGEMSVLADKSQRNATIQASRDTELIRLTGEGFERLALKYPQLGLIVTREMIEKFRQATSGQYEASPLSTIAIIPASKEIPISAFMEEFENALAVHGDVFFLNSERFDGELGEGASLVSGSDSRNTELVTWLNDLEFTNSFVLLVTDMELTEWTRRCLRMADRILIVANAEESPSPQGIEKQLYEIEDEKLVVSMELVLLHPARDIKIENTKQWLTPRRLVRHHHLHMGTAQDFERLARLISGKAVGLVLSGGGARGLVHIGTIRALEESNILFDVIGGTSFGSTVAACIALEWDWMQMQEVIYEFVKTRDKYFRPTLPGISLLGGHQINQWFQSLYGTYQIEDLWRPSFYISSNLTHSRLHIHNQGSLWRSVRASMSIPGVFPPVLMDGQLLVDGGTLNNLPADVMRNRNDGGIVIASKVSSDITYYEDVYPYGDNLTGWQLLWNRLNPFKEKINVPSIANIVTQTLMLGSKMALQQQMANADLLIDHQTQEFGMFDYDAIDELVELGYRTTLESLEAWDRIDEVKSSP